MFYFGKSDCRRVKRSDRGGCGDDGGERTSNGPLVSIAEAKGDVKASNGMSRIDGNDTARRKDNIGVLQRNDKRTQGPRVLNFSLPSSNDDLPLAVSLIALPSPHVSQGLNLLR